MATLGTLIVIVLKARNLPNKARLGKQSPFAELKYGPHTKKTMTIQRGGQTPEWDEEFRFEIKEDMEDALSTGVDRSGGVKPMPPGSRTPKTGGSKTLLIACYADDGKEPELIGEAVVDLTEPLRKGEIDMWVQLQAKGREAGEIFCEMTFYSSGPPPPKKVAVPRAATHNSLHSHSQVASGDTSDSSSRGSLRSTFLDSSHIRPASSNGRQSVDMGRYPDADLYPLSDDLQGSYAADSVLRRSQSMQHMPAASGYDQYGYPAPGASVAGRRPLPIPPTVAGASQHRPLPRPVSQGGLSSYSPYEQPQYYPAVHSPPPQVFSPPPMPMFSPPQQATSAFNDVANQYYAQQSRLVSGAVSPPPTMYSPTPPATFGQHAYLNGGHVPLPPGPPQPAGVHAYGGFPAGPPMPPQHLTQAMPLGGMHAYAQQAYPGGPPPPPPPPQHLQNPYYPPQY